jgi:hypothetical protein
VQRYAFGGIEEGGMRLLWTIRTACALSLLALLGTVAVSCSGTNGSVFGGIDAATDDGTDDSGSLADGTVLGSDGSSTDGGGGPCTPSTCAQQQIACGPAGDGCGNVIQCGSCPPNQVCRGNGPHTPIQCSSTGLAPDGAPVCTPTTCAQLGYDCGPAADGCGGLLQCGMCKSGQVCGAQKPGVCGSGVPCTGLCQQQVACDGGVSTTVTGRVVAGTLPKYGAPDPVPGVLVYVPNAPLQPFAPGVSCGCPPVSGDPLVWTTTAVDGTFTLKNVPVGNGIPIVIQLGRWRRATTFNSPPACTTASIGDIHMPRSRTDGLNNQADIPLTALSTGQVDALECVLLKMGVDAAEFADPSVQGNVATAPQRIHLYFGNGAQAPGGTTPEATLTSNPTLLAQYDQVLFPCWGQPVDKPAANRTNMVNYTSAGGRMFATHYSYTWLYKTSPFDQTATWNPDTQYASVTGDIDTSFARGATFGQWMTLIAAASGTPPAFLITSPRQDFINPVPPSLRYIYADDPANNDYPLHYTFDMPWKAMSTCGRVVYSDFHVADVFGVGTFPSECDNSPLNAQEKALEYMIWDLGQCLAPQMPVCTPRTCTQQGIGCGPAGDGCGNVIQCGTCAPPQTCGGGGTPSQCGYPEAGPCVPATCAALGVQCGPAADGCGGLLQCGSCAPPQTCGGGGTPGVCGGGGVQ